KEPAETSESALDLTREGAAPSGDVPPVTLEPRQQDDKPELQVGEGIVSKEGVIDEEDVSLRAKGRVPQSDDLVTDGGDTLGLKIPDKAPVVEDALDPGLRLPEGGALPTKEASEADLLGQPLDVKRKPFDLDELDNLDSSNVSEVTKNELEENLKNDLKKFTGKK
ncbi:hypothetical protein N9O62_03105, partial [Burkholderiaceae bacterium]|nr:hypothetical protein [Burkholderiaceae bacterium]